MKYVNLEEYIKYVEEIKSYAAVEEKDETVTIKSGMHIGLIVAHKDGKGYMIDDEILK